MNCHVVLIATGDICGARAVCRLTFKDGDKVNACADCAVRLKQQIPDAIIKTEKIQ